MSKSDNKQAIIVGIFIFLGIVIFIAAVLTLGSKQKTFVAKVQIKAVFDDVSGLKQGNNIWFSGVKVGTIKAINLLGEKKVEVVMGIEEQVHKFIRKDATAKLGSEGLIGNKIVVISGGSAQSPQVVDGDQLKVERVISTDDILNTLQENNKNLVAITSDFKSVSSKIANGEGTLGALLTNDQMAGNIKTMLSNLQTASQNTNKISAALNQFSGKLNNKDGLANQLLTDTVVFANLKSSVAQLQKTTETANQVAANLDKASGKFNSTDNAVGTLLNDQQVSSDLKNTIKNLESSTEKLNENMEALKHNFLFRGYFKDQEKKAAKEKKQSGN
ncbi:MCE family protein [Pedobacter sp. HMF7647]|uniref:MCE family protein n=1 Tax=Hufsiella arboris TaxID=2695275 RepID=A0A7K1YD80_9SPHI|nr:MlaD family protein [Hufsiella arboris]MXV52544.1 MCE family protein [Hufsiella arboris]